jgi:hypothetical protein
VLRRKRWLVGVVALTAIFAGCNTPAPSTETASSDLPAPLVAAAPASCHPLDLRSPDGEQVDLTGAWQGGVTFHEARQSDDCVWWVGFSSWPGDDLGSAWLLTFSGHIAPDFTLSGEWSEIFTAELHAPRNCPATFEIEFIEDGEIELTTEIPEDDPCSYYAATMRRVDGPP